MCLLVTCKYESENNANQVSSIGERLVGLVLRLLGSFVTNTHDSKQEASHLRRHVHARSTHERKSQSADRAVLCLVVRGANDVSAHT